MTISLIDAAEALLVELENRPEAERRALSHYLASLCAASSNDKTRQIICMRLQALCATGAPVFPKNYERVDPDKRLDPNEVELAEEFGSVFVHRFRATFNRSLPKDIDQFAGILGVAYMVGRRSTIPRGTLNG